MNVETKQTLALKVFDCLINGVVLIFGSEKACSKIGESKVCGSASNRTMVNYKLN